VECAIADAAAAWGLNVRVFASVAWCESRLDPDAYNPSSASGLFQHLARYFDARAEAAGVSDADIFDPVANAQAAGYLMSSQGMAPWEPSRWCWG